MAPSQVLEGTWEELSVHAPTFHGKKLRLMILENEVPADEGEAARIAAIRAGMGKFADPKRKTRASEELRHERQRDDAQREQTLGSTPS